MTDAAPTCDPLLASLVDDAGLFPPTELPMAEALARHQADARGRHPMLTHRFLVRASRIGELRETVGADSSLRLGLILDTDPAAWGDAISAVQDDPRLAVAMVDVPIPTGEDPEAFAAAAGTRLDRDAPGAPVFFEPPGPEWLAVPGGGTVRGLKVRCGGARADLFPSPAQLGAFMVACARQGTSFKATAGLHEAVRHTNAETGFTHHGFLNLLVAAARAATGADAAGVEAALSLTDSVTLVAEIAAMPAGHFDRRSPSDGQLRVVQHLGSSRGSRPARARHHGPVSGPIYPTAAELGVDVFDPAVFARGMPWAGFARLRDEAPVCWHEEPPVGDWPAGTGFWAVTRWEDIRAVGRAAQLFSSQLGATQLRDPAPEDLGFWQEMLLNSDPPEHTRLRRIVGVAFTGKEIARHEPVIRERSRRLIDEVVEAGRCDFAEDIGARLPLLTIAELWVSRPATSTCCRSGPTG